MIIILWNTTERVVGPWQMLQYFWVSAIFYVFLLLRDIREQELTKQECFVSSYSDKTMVIW